MNYQRIREKRERIARLRVQQGRATKKQLRFLERLEQQERLLRAERERLAAFERAVEKGD